MTVKDLINKLSEMPLDVEVIHPCPTGGSMIITCIEFDEEAGHVYIS